MRRGENCGLVGISLDREDSAFLTYYALYALQHRGQESAGIAVNRDGICVIKEMGLVPEVFDKEKITKLRGDKSVGHVRYSTTGLSRIENAQPLHVSYKGGDMAIAHNGNLVNSDVLRNNLERRGRVFLSESDTEVIAHLLVNELMRADYEDAFVELTNHLIGSYSLVILVNDTLLAVRDPLGIKPLCFGEIDGGYIVASESTAIDSIGGNFIRDVRPGEMLIFGDGVESKQICKTNKRAHCVFEYIYFARPDSVLDGKLVYGVRLRMGEKLAMEHEVDADIVSPIPDSGITSAIGYARKSGVDYLEALIKNRYVGRTFIMPSPSLREESVSLKLNVISENVRDKRVILVDDSIVRGTTSRRIVESLRKKGSKEVHMRIGSPPIIAPCHFGIDMPTREELMASDKSIAEINKTLNADSTGYLSLGGLVNSIEMPADKLCMACLTGIYP